MDDRPVRLNHFEAKELTKSLGPCPSCKDQIDLSAIQCSKCNFLLKRRAKDPKSTVCPSCKGLVELAAVRCSKCNYAIKGSFRGKYIPGLYASRPAPEKHAVMRAEWKLTGATYKGTLYRCQACTGFAEGMEEAVHVKTGDPFPLCNTCAAVLRPSQVTKAREEYLAAMHAQALAADGDKTINSDASLPTKAPEMTCVRCQNKDIPRTQSQVIDWDSRKTLPCMHAFCHTCYYKSKVLRPNVVHQVLQAFITCNACRRKYLILAEGYEEVPGDLGVVRLTASVEGPKKLDDHDWDAAHPRAYADEISLMSHRIVQFRQRRYVDVFHDPAVQHTGFISHEGKVRSVKLAAVATSTMLEPEVEAVLEEIRKFCKDRTQAFAVLRTWPWNKEKFLESLADKVSARRAAGDMRCVVCDAEVDYKTLTQVETKEFYIRRLCGVCQGTA